MQNRDALSYSQQFSCIAPHLKHTRFMCRMVSVKSPQLKHGGQKSRARHSLLGRAPRELSQRTFEIRGGVSLSVGIAD